MRDVQKALSIDIQDLITSLTNEMNLIKHARVILNSYNFYITYLSISPSVRWTMLSSGYVCYYLMANTMLLIV